MIGDAQMPFGKFNDRTIDETPSDYLYAVVLENADDWVRDRYGDEFVEEVELVLSKRDREDSHWHEMEEPYDR